MVDYNMNCTLPAVTRPPYTGLGVYALIYACACVYMRMCVLDSFPQAPPSFSSLAGQGLGTRLRMCVCMYLYVMCTFVGVHVFVCEWSGSPQV